MNSRATLHAALVLVATTSRAFGTYSIVASDSVTRQTGGAGTSCLRGGDVYIIYGSVPGGGAVHAQALANQNARNRAVELLEQGMAPADIVTAITASGFDSNSASRQYGVVDVMGRSAGFTGSSAQAFADDRQGQVGTFSYSVQGNILTSAAVLTQAAAAFEASAGCDLADRLMRSLEAGADNDEGDSRCTDSLGIPSDSAFVQVEAPGTARGSFLSLRVRASGNADPLVELRADYDAWRSANPCPSPGGGAGGAGGTSNGGMAGSATGGSAGATTGGATTGGAPEGGTATGGGGAGPSAGGAGGAAGATPVSGSGGASVPTGSGDDSSGCGCRLGRTSAPFAALAAFALAAWLGARRRAR